MSSRNPSPSSGRIGAACLALLAGVLIAPGSALAAASRYAAPTNQGTGDCSSPANACALSTAISGATSGDDIFILANLGDYMLGASNIGPGSAVTLHFHGMNGRPRIFSTTSNYVLNLNAPSSSADDLYLQNTAGGGGMSFNPGSGKTISVNNVIVDDAGAGAGHACYLGGGVTLTNSVCWLNPSGMTSDLGIETDGANTLRNDVVWVNAGSIGLRAFGRSGVAGVDTLINTIVGGTGPHGDLQADAADGTATATITVTHSNFVTTNLAGTTSMDAINTDSSDQSTPPLLVNPGSGDFHEVTGSPTIAAGLTDPANGANDFNGAPRATTTTCSFSYGSTPSLGQATPSQTLNTTDIGVDQYVAAPGAANAPVSNVTPTSATLNGTVNPNGAASGLSIATALTGLSPDTPYYFALMCINPNGSSSASPASFKTAIAPRPPSSLPSISVLISNTFSFTLSTDKKGDIIATVTEPGPGSVTGSGMGTVKGKKLRAAGPARKGHKKATTITYGMGSATATGPGTVKLTIAPTKKARKALKRAKRLNVAVSITFSPTGGTAATKTASIRVKNPKRKHHR